MKKGLMEVRGISYNFAGFYWSIFDRDDAFDFEGAPEVVQKFLGNGHIWDYVRTKDYRREVATDWITNLMCYTNTGLEIKDISIISPAFYNFETDKIKYTAVLPKPFEQIVDEVKDHPFFAEFLKQHFTLRDGFFPFYSNDVSQFIKTMEERDIPYEIEVGAILYVYTLIKNVIENETFDEVEKSLLDWAEGEAVCNDEELFFDTEKFVADISKQMNVKGQCNNWWSILDSKYDSATNTLIFK